ncbi:1-hydroxy-2-methyl-2-butenyl 4-diphosphate reductase [Streptomyces sp. NPDC005963]|uniref:phosphorylase family protein n=1 Tax=Streptomyces sp. NPDC005963 TaxID=3156721 RepID=UPI0033C5B117
MADSPGPSPYVPDPGPAACPPPQHTGAAETPDASSSAPEPGGHPEPSDGPLLIVCALAIERLALRAGARGVQGRATVLRTGMGPVNAARGVGAALADPCLRGAAVIASGFCAGLAPDMRPGDLVVATRTRGAEHATGADADTPCTETSALADAVARAVPGRQVHTGVLIGSAHIVRGPERAALHAGGAIAVDMESAVSLRTALAVGPRPVAAVRVVVDAPEHELVRIGTVRGGISAFHVLRAVLPAFHEWHRSLLLPRR